MKNLLLVIVVFLSLISCGKKSDPVYDKKSGLIKMKVYGTSDS